MAKFILTHLTLTLAISLALASSGFCGETKPSNQFASAIRALAANRSLLSHCKNETEATALKEDREKLFKTLPTELQAYELMKDQLVEKASLPKTKMPKHEEKIRSPETYRLHQKALGLVAEDHLGDAAKMYEQIILIDPNDDEAYILMGHSYFLTGQYEKAEAAYHNAINIDLENRKEIAPFYENFILQNPSDDTAYTNLGYAYLMLGENSKAKDAFRDALSIQPDNESARAGLRKIGDLGTH